MLIVNDEKNSKANLNIFFLYENKLIKMDI